MKYMESLISQMNSFITNVIKVHICKYTICENINKSLFCLLTSWPKLILLTFHIYSLLYIYSRPIWRMIYSFFSSLRYTYIICFRCIQGTRPFSRELSEPVRETESGTGNCRKVCLLICVHNRWFRQDRGVDDM
jgi:hypothetical protein